MISVWRFIAFLTTITASLAAMQDTIPKEHEIVSAHAPLKTITNNMSRLNEIQLAILKDNLHTKYPINFHNNDAFGAKLRTHFTTIKDIHRLECINYRPRNASIKDKSSKKTISIVTYPDLQAKPDYLGWYKENTLTYQSTQFAKYVPQVGTHYIAIQANKDGSLVAAGYGDNTPPHRWGNQIDIIDAHNISCVKKLITIFMPGNADIMNMQFTNNDTTLLTRTKNKLYAWDLQGVLMERSTIDGATQVIQNQDYDAKELANALLSLKKSTQRMEVYYQKKQTETDSENSDQVPTDKRPEIMPVKMSKLNSFARIVAVGLFFALLPQPVG